jgi:hypothetical protein
VEQVLPPLFDRVERLVVRQESSDHSYLFLATRLLLMLAVQSQAAFAFLADNKAAWEAWLEVRASPFLSLPPPPSAHPLDMLKLGKRGGPNPSPAFFPTACDARH